MATGARMKPWPITITRNASTSKPRRRSCAKRRPIGYADRVPLSEDGGGSAQMRSRTAALVHVRGARHAEGRLRRAGEDRNGVHREGMLRRHVRKGARRNVPE